MQYPVRISDRALRDLEGIYQYIEADSSDAAFTWFRYLADAIYSLERFPERGQVIPEDGKLRHLPFAQKPHVYRIIYAIDKRKGTMEILHIRDGARGTLRAEEAV